MLGQSVGIEEYNLVKDMLCNIPDMNFIYFSQNTIDKTGGVHIQIGKTRIIKIGYTPHDICKRKKGEISKKETDNICHQRRYSARRLMVERTNSWHTRLRKMSARY